MTATELHEKAIANQKATAAAFAQAEKLLADLTSKKDVLQEQLARDRDAVTDAERAAVKAQMDGGRHGVEVLAKLRDLARVTELTISDLSAQIEQARVAVETTRAASAVAAGIAEKANTAAAMAQHAPRAIDAIAAMVASEPAGGLGVRLTISEISKHVAAGQTDRARAVASEFVATLEKNITTALGLGQMEVAAVEPAPPDNTLIFASRAVRFRFRDGTDRTLPSNWVGLIPDIVAARLEALGMARRLDPVAWYLVRQDVTLAIDGSRTMLTAGRRVLLLESQAQRLVADSIVEPLQNLPVTHDDTSSYWLRRLTSEPSSFDRAIDLGVIDAPAEQVAADVQNIAEAAAKAPRDTRSPRRLTRPAA